MFLAPYFVQPDTKLFMINKKTKISRASIQIRSININMCCHQMILQGEDDI